MKHTIEELDIGQLDLIESEGKTMNNDLISRQVVIKAIHDEREWLDANIQSAQHHYHMMNETTKILGIIGNLPAVQSKQKTGRWIEQTDTQNDVYYVCSNCKEAFTLIEGTPTDNLYNYCPNCGSYNGGDNNG